MESLDPRSAIRSLTQTLRRATTLAKVIPFVYLVAFALCAVLEPFLSDRVMCFADSILYVPVPVVAVMLVLSRIFKLCIWHRTACVLPLTAQLVSLIDSYVFQFTCSEICCINVTIGVLCLVFAVRAYNHFRA